MTTTQVRNPELVELLKCDFYVRNLSIVLEDDQFVGLGVSGGRIVFDSTPAVDCVHFENCDVGIGSSASPTANGGRVLFFGDNTNDPTMDTNTCGFYGKDVGGTVEAFAIDEASNATQLTSHNFNLFEPPEEARYPWSVYFRNEYLGIEMAVDMWSLVKAVETLTGGQFLYEREIERKEYGGEKPLPHWMEDRIGR